MTLIAHASRDERGKYSGGKPGDQDGKEVCIRTWYSRPWNVVMRARNSEMQSKIAKAMTDAANNQHIGYSQGRRNDALTAARKFNYDISKVTVDCSTDCSALVSLACMYAGIPESALYKGGNSSTTSNLKSRLKATGAFEIFTSKEYTAKSDKLLAGDILLYEGHHVAVVVKSDVVTKDTKSITAIAQDVIDGKYGTGSERKRFLTMAGYDYSAVQTEVNRLLKK